MIAIFFSPASRVIETNTPNGYVAGIIIAILILGYLVYTLAKPEKF
jgi:K+-transporting ATPase KdpF subunit